MGARLVQFEDGREVNSRPLDGNDTVVGRDPHCDLVVSADERISRRHAVVERRGSHHVVADLGSSNGTRLNGETLGHETVLAPGDRIELSDRVWLVYEAAPPRRLPVMALALLVLIAVAGASWWAARTPPPLIEGSALARQGLEAFRGGDPATAKRRFQEAAGLLYHEGLLDDVPRHQVMTVAMQQLGGTLEEEVDLLAVFQQVIEQSQPKRDAPRPDPVGCRLDRIGSDRFDRCLRDQVQRVFVGLRQDPSDIPDWFYDEVALTLRRERAFLERAFERGEPYVEGLKRELEQVRMPPLLHYLALIESGYRPDAGSPKGAVGLWQFIPSTARRYGLKVGNGHDERRDPHKSTRAAARYLRDLAFEFGGDALLLALAGYNRGENGVRRALKRLEDPFSDRSYWVLVERELLPAETRQYVPRFVAAAAAGEGGLPRATTLAEAVD